MQQVHNLQNVYIGNDSKQELVPLKATLKRTLDDPIKTERNKSIVRQVKKSEFLPQISNGRRLMKIEHEEITKESNPFKLQPNSERILAQGERARELGKLVNQKFNLIQKIADNQDYVENLSKKQLNIRGDRSGVISDVKQITRINALPPHINLGKGSPTARRSPSPSGSTASLSRDPTEMSNNRSKPFGRNNRNSL